MISDAAGEARKTTAPATSIGSPIRCRPAIRSTTSARKAGSASAGSVPGGADERRRDRVDGDAVLAPLDREALRHVGDRRLDRQ